VSFTPELRHVARPSRPPTPLARARRVVPGPTPTPYPFAKAFACAGVAFALGVAAMVLYSVHQDPLQAQAGALGPVAARALAFAAVASFAPALVTGMVVQQSPRPWRFRDIALAFAGMFAVTAGLHVVGLAH
jgi:hypothetical protein